MKLEDIKTITIIGAGSMGHGIAQLAATAGYNVVLRDINEEAVQGGYEKIKWSLGKFAEKGRITQEQAEEIIGRVSTAVDIKEAVQNADFVIEAAPEIMSLKQELFKELDEHTPKHAILASNTSSLSISEIGDVTSRPELVVGMHYFNPPVMMALVEVIKGHKTDEGVMDLTVELTRKLGKSPIRVEKDVFGFIVNRVLVGPFMFESAWQVSRGQATVEEIDSRMKFYEGFPMGPFELQDLTGIDIGYHLTQEAGFPIPSLIEETVAAKKHGRKTGEGFYKYGEGEAGANYSQEAGKNFDPAPIYALMVNEACELIDQDVSNPHDIDQAVQLGAGFPEGILSRADNIGLDVLLNALEALHNEYGDERYKPSDLFKKMVADGHTGKAAGQGFYNYGGNGSGSRDYKVINVDVADGIGWITLNRPARLNAINSEMMEELPHAFDALTTNDDVNVIVIKGEGDKAFSAGADITEFAGGKPYQFAGTGSALFNAPMRCPKPVIAAIDGFALGGGLELALACDFRVASKRSEVGQPEILLGLIPGGGGTQRLVRLIGPSRTKELVMLGHRISAKTAKKWGLVNHVYDDDEFEAEVQAYAAKFAAGPPIAIQFTKSVVDLGADAPIETALRLEQQAFGLLFSTDDMVEGTSSFMMKKKPEFKGK